MTTEDGKIQFASETCRLVEQLLNDYVDEEISPGHRELVDAHLLTCSACRVALEELRELLRTARSLNDEPLDREVRQRLRHALKERVGFEVPRSKRTMLKVVPVMKR